MNMYKFLKRNTSRFLNINIQYFQSQISLYKLRWKKFMKDLRPDRNKTILNLFFNSLFWSH